ncbi:MAG: hypothetical protein IT318_03390 [Anaerolineales bacterium]|nr:hypothetical protein [Anaerolineales bacterium]
MEITASRHRTLPCAACGRAAAEIALLPAAITGASPWHTRDRLERTDFLGTITKFGATQTLLALYEAIEQGNFAAAASLDSDFVAFHCRDCGQVYCDTCWRLSPPVFDDGHYAYTLGACPRGHEHIVDA